MPGLKYQLKNIRRDKMCILTFFLPIIVGLAINLMPSMNFSSVSNISLGILRNNLSEDTVKWLEGNGVVTVYETPGDLREAVNDPATQIIGVLRDDDGIRTMRSGDELQMMAAVSDTLPMLYEERSLISGYDRTIIPPKSGEDILSALFISITLVTAMFMGCTFNAMSIISEKEDGIVFINEVLPMTERQYMLQKMALGFTGGILSTAMTAAICMSIGAEQIAPLVLLIILSAFIAALTGLFIGRFANDLMVGIVFIKVVMILFLAPPILFYLIVPPGGILYALSYVLPSSATFYGLMDMLKGGGQDIWGCIGVLGVHCVVWPLLYLALSGLRRV